MVDKIPQRPFFLSLNAFPKETDVEWQDASMRGDVPQSLCPLPQELATAIDLVLQSPALKRKS